MNEFKLIIATPEGNIFGGDAVSIMLRGSEGDLAILKGHIPFITAVKPCDCHVELPDGSNKSYEIDGGILTVAQDSVTLLAGTAEKTTNHI